MGKSKIEAIDDTERNARRERLWQMYDDMIKDLDNCIQNDRQSDLYKLAVWVFHNQQGIHTDIKRSDLDILNKHDIKKLVSLHNPNIAGLTTRIAIPGLFLIAGTIAGIAAPQMHAQKSKDTMNQIHAFTKTAGDLSNNGGSILDSLQQGRRTNASKVVEDRERKIQDQNSALQHAKDSLTTFERSLTEEERRRYELMVSIMNR